MDYCARQTGFNTVTQLKGTDEHDISRDYETAIEGLTTWKQPPR